MGLPGPTVRQAVSEWENSMKINEQKPQLGMPFRALMKSLRKGVTREQLQAAERQW